MVGRGGEGGGGGYGFSVCLDPRLNARIHFNKVCLVVGKGALGISPIFWGALSEMWGD